MKILSVAEAAYLFGTDYKKLQEPLIDEEILVVNRKSGTVTGRIKLLSIPKEPEIEVECPHCESTFKYKNSMKYDR